MARKKREFTTFNLSFLDIMSCGFGAVVLVFLIIDHSLKTENRELNRDLLSEVRLLEEDVRDGEEGLVRLRNTLSEVDLQMVDAPLGVLSIIKPDLFYAPAFGEFLFPIDPGCFFNSWITLLRQQVNDRCFAGAGRPGNHMPVGLSLKWCRKDLRVKG